MDEETKRSQRQGSFMWRRDHRCDGTGKKSDILSNFLYHRLQPACPTAKFVSKQNNLWSPLTKQPSQGSLQWARPAKTFLCLKWRDKPLAPNWISFINIKQNLHIVNSSCWTQCHPLSFSRKNFEDLSILRTSTPCYPHKIKNLPGCQMQNVVTHAEAQSFTPPGIRTPPTWFCTATRSSTQPGREPDSVGTGAKRKCATPCSKSSQ